MIRFKRARGLTQVFQFQVPAPVDSALRESVADMMRLQEVALLAPFRFWIQAAEAWQRNWAEAMTGPYQSGQARPTRRTTNYT